MSGREEVRLVPIGDLHPSPYQSRRRPRRSSLDGLAASIRAQGVVVPLVARPRGDGGLEIVAGHRRREAAELAGLSEVPVVVRELSDAAASAQLVEENRNRLDLEPLEEAAAIARALRANGGSAAAVAAALGTSESFVLRRARLLHLARPWREAARDASSVVSSWSAAHLEVVARLPEAAQLSLWDEVRWSIPARPTVRRLEELAATVTRELRAAQWRLTDGDLYPEAGPCSGCRKRTSVAPLLFGDRPKVLGRDDRCLDAACWAEKLRRTCRERTDRALELVDRAGGERPLLVHVGEAAPADYPGAVPQGAVAAAEDGAPSVLAVVVDGPGAGSTYRAAAAAAASHSAARTAAVAKRLRRLLAERLAVEVLPQLVVAAAAAFGCSGVDDPWVALARYGSDDDAATAALWSAVTARMLRHVPADDPDRAFAAARIICDFVAEDFQGLVEAAEAEVRG